MRIASASPTSTRKMAHRKPHLPTKTCSVCGRPFAWRKKWARDWEAVIYCSERCRRTAKARRTAADRRPDA